MAKKIRVTETALYLLSTYDEADLSFSGYEKNELPAPLTTTLTGKPISVILPTA